MGNTPVDDAIRENRAIVITYLEKVMSFKYILDSCQDFNDGLLKKGI